MSTFTVKISKELIVQVLSQGNEARAKCTKGLPADSRLVDVVFRGNYVDATFQSDSVVEPEAGDGFFSVEYENMDAA